MLQLSDSQVFNRYPHETCRELSMFGALSRDSVDFLFSQGKVLDCNSGTVLFECGERSDQFYILLSGRVAYYRCDGDAQVYIRSFKRGEQIGFSGMIGLQNRVGMGVVEQHTTVLEISCELFHQVCDRFPADFVIFLINMTREMSREITDLDAICSRLNTRTQHAVTL